MKLWPNQKQSHDDNFPGGFLYARHQNAEADKQPDSAAAAAKAAADTAAAKAAADAAAADDAEDDPEKIDPAKLKNLKEDRNRHRARADAAIATAAKLQKENEAFKKAEEARQAASLSEIEKEKLARQKAEAALADSKAETARAQRQVSIATHQVDPEYLEVVDGLLAKAMTAEGFESESWFKALKEKKPALFLGADAQTLATGGGPQRQAGGNGEIAKLNQRIDALKANISMLNQEEQMELNHLISKRNALKASG